MIDRLRDDAIQFAYEFQAGRKMAQARMAESDPETMGDLTAFIREIAKIETPLTDGALFEITRCATYGRS